MEASHESSPLHKVFDWDDSSAGNKYRLFQARLIINNIRVEIMGNETSAFINAVVKVDKIPMRGYISTTKALKKKDVMRQIVAIATREIEYWQRKYEAYEALQKVINTTELNKLKGGE